MSTIKTLVVAFTFLSFPSFAKAQNIENQTTKLQIALKNNDRIKALEEAILLYDLSLVVSDFKTAGFAAYTKASIYDQNKESLKAAKAYDQCSNHYGRVNSLAQSIQCEYRSALSYISAYKPGNAVDALNSSASRLEDIGQGQSSLASQVYATLAQEMLPSKLDNTRYAKQKRLKSIEYSDKALLALEASGQSKTENFASILSLKGIAQDDSENYDAAIKSYEEAIEIYSALPNSSKETLETIRSRLSIARFGLEKPKKKNSIEVIHKNGDVLNLKIKRKKSVKVPRVNKNQIVDGAKASVEIDLSETGAVRRVTVLKSEPSKEYGDALKKAVETWTFILPENISGTDIEPFEYGMIFYVKRL